MNSLFSTFDPQSFFSLPLCWVAIFCFFVFMPSNFWPCKSAPTKVLSTPVAAIHQEFTIALGHWANPGTTLILLSLLLFISLNNALGLLPYLFTASSHLSFTLTLALPLWAGHMVMAWLKLPQNMLAHLVPTGTPPALMPFMVIIEIISSLIRPLTLSVRLAANMMAGHLLLTLVTQSAPALGYGIISLILVSVIALATLESAVALIQAYVFSVLSTLYIQEVNSPSLSS